MIPKEILAEYKDKQSELEGIKSLVVDRIDKIWTVMFEAYGVKRPKEINWYFPDIIHLYLPLLEFYPVLQSGSCSGNL